MIKTTVNNQAVTSSAWESDVREVDSKAYYYTSTNTWVVIPNEITEWSVTKGVCGDDKFEIGTVFIPTGSITFSTSDEESAIPNDVKIIRIDAGVKVGSEFEYLSMGIYWITERTSDSYTTTFTLTSYLLGGRSGRAFKTDSTSHNVSEILSGAAKDMGGITFDSDVQLPAYNLKKAVTGGTCRDALGAVALSYGLCVTENSNGVIFKKLFPSGYDSIVVDESMLAEPFVSKGTFNFNTGKIVVVEGYNGTDSDEGADADTSDEIKEVSYTFQKTSSSSGAVINTGVDLESWDWIINNEYMSKPTFTAFCKFLQGEITKWEAGTVELQLGDPRIEPLDVIQLMQGETQTHSIYAWHITHSYDGGYSSTITAAPQERSDSAVGYDVSGSGVAVIVPIVDSKLDGVKQEIHKVELNLGQAIDENRELTMSESERLEHRIESVETASKYKVDTNLVKNDIVVGSCEWNTDYNRLVIGGGNEAGNRYYQTSIGGDGILFQYGSNKNQVYTVASINQDRLEINKTVVFTESIIGEWSWTTDLTTGDLSLKYIGV